MIIAIKLKIKSVKLK